MPKVWCMFDGVDEESTFAVILRDDQTKVIELKQEIKQMHLDTITNGIKLIRMKIYDGSSENELQDGDDIPSGSSFETPVRVKVPGKATEQVSKLLYERTTKGLHYSTLNQVWLRDPQPFQGSFEKLCRPSGYADAKVPAYAKILQDALTTATHSQIDLQSESVSNAESRIKKLNFDIFGNGPASRAHCIPADKLCCAVYGILALAVVGAAMIIPNLLGRDDAINAIRILIYGLRKDTGTGWGLKNLPHNIVVLPDPHKEHFDLKGDWIIVPIMKLDGVKAWGEGEVYEALVIAGASDGGSNQLSSSSAEIYRRLFRQCDYEDPRGKKIGMEKATPEDIGVATQLLRDMVGAVADVLNRETGNEGGPIAPSELLAPRGQNITDEIKKKKQWMEDAKEALLKDGLVEMPLLNGNGERFLLMKVPIRKLQGVDTLTDPMLLGLKAAIQWSLRGEYKLMPACGPSAPEEDEADLLAQEACREMSMRSSFDPRFASLQGGDDPSPMLTRFITATPERGLIHEPQLVTPSPPGRATGDASGPLANSAEGSIGGGI